MAANENNRCPWAGDDPVYQKYHDDEWGVPKTDEIGLFEKLCLEGFQAGLSWITILRKRNHFRKVFDGFNPEKLVCYDDAKIETLLQDPGIIRNRLKINAAISNARAYLKLREQQSLASFLWGYVDGRPVQNHFNDLTEIPTETELSRRISKDLKKLGFKFCGPTIMYAYMQSVGMINDHLTSCPHHKICADMAEKFEFQESR